MGTAIQTWLGNLSGGEWILVGVFVLAILSFSWLPRLSGAIGSWFDR